LRILALGDSYTIGESVGEAERWPEQLAARLRERGLEVAAPRIIAQTGWTTLRLELEIRRAELDPPYDLVTLLIGVNDQFQGQPDELYPKRFQPILKRAIELAGDDPTHVLVLSIPDYGVTPFGQRMGGGSQIGAVLDGYNAAARERTLRAGVEFVDITPISREALREPELVARDGLHPSGEMYRRWVELVLPLAERALGGDTRPAP